MMTFSPRQCPSRRPRRGYALVYCTLMITFLSILGVTLLSLSTSSNRLAQRRRLSAQALSLATGAMDYSLGRFKKGSFSGLPTRTLGAGSVTVTVASVAGKPSQREVTATAVVTEQTTSLTRTVVTRVDEGTVPPVFFNALAAKTSFTLNGNLSIDSIPLLNQGNVHCNEDVTLHGSSMSVLGKVTASGSVNVSGSPLVVGGMESGAPKMEFPEIDQTLKDQALTAGTRNSSLSVNSATTLVAGKIVGDLSIGNSGCRVEGVVWVTGDIDCSGPVSGKGTLICDGSMTLDARYLLSALNVDRVMWITTSKSSSAVDLGGNRVFKGLIYAPNGGVRLHGTPDLIGGVMADSVTFSGNPTITRWTSFTDDPPPMPRYFQLRGWQEY